jgi:prepilin signal peptidase PulO-like enzyme (type II secretory pathway)
MENGDIRLIFFRFRRCAVSLRAPYLFLFEFLAALTALRAGSFPEILCEGVLELCLLFLSVSDWERAVIPNPLIRLPAVCRTIFLLCTSGWQTLLLSLASAALLALLLVLISQIGEHFTGAGHFGGGDIKLFALAGLYLGVKRGLWCIILACIFGIITSRSIHRRRFPFGPAISAALICCLLLPG